MSQATSARCSAPHHVAEVWHSRNFASLTATETVGHTRQCKSCTTFWQFPAICMGIYLGWDMTELALDRQLSMQVYFLQLVLRTIISISNGWAGVGIDECSFVRVRQPVPRGARGGLASFCLLFLSVTSTSWASAPLCMFENGLLLSALPLLASAKFNSDRASVYDHAPLGG